jgi:hypothetical protein
LRAAKSAVSSHSRSSSPVHPARQPKGTSVQPTDEPKMPHCGTPGRQLCRSDNDLRRSHSGLTDGLSEGRVADSREHFHSWQSCVRRKSRRGPGVARAGRIAGEAYGHAFREGGFVPAAFQSRRCPMYDRGASCQRRQLQELLQDFLRKRCRPNLAFRIGVPGVI